MNVVLVRHGKGDNLNDNANRGHFHRNVRAKKIKDPRQSPSGIAIILRKILDPTCFDDLHGNQEGHLYPMP